VICPHESGAGKTFAAVKYQQRSKNNTWTRKTEESKDMEPGGRNKQKIG